MGIASRNTGVGRSVDGASAAARSAVPCDPAGDAGSASGGGAGGPGSCAEAVVSGTADAGEAVGASGWIHGGICVVWNLPVPHNPPPIRNAPTANPMTNAATVLPLIVIYSS